MATILTVAYTNYSRDPRVRRQAEALVQMGHRVVALASFQPNEPRSEIVDGVEVIKLRGISNLKTSVLVYILDYALFFMRVALHLTRHPLRYQLIHVNNMPDFLVFATLLPRLLGTPVIHDVHDLMPELFAEKFEAGERSWVVRLLRIQERWAGAFASAVLTVEARLKEILASRGIPEGKIHVLMNLPDERIFSPSAKRVRATDGRFVIVYHGTLARRLGLDLAIRAVADAAKHIGSLEFRIIGAGEERQSLIELAKLLSVSEIVRFSDGYVPVQQVVGLIADADIAVIPLRISSGTEIMLPTKLLEYVSMGIPCIAPRTRTIATYFDEEMVEYFEAGCVASLSCAIRRLHDDPARRANLARQSMDRFGSRYRWTIHRQIYTDLVTGLLATRQ